MNKLKVLEAMNMIDDDLVKEAEVPSDTVSEAVNGEKISGEVTVSGVEVYRRSGWRWFAAIASAVVFIGAVTAAGGFYLKNRGGSAPDNEIIESEALAPTTGTGSSEESSEVSEKPEITKQDKTDDTQAEHTEAATNADAEQPVAIARTTEAPAHNGEKPRNTQTTAQTRTNDGKTTTIATTVKIQPTTESPKPQVPIDGRMTVYTVQALSECGGSLLWGDFKDYSYEDVGSGQDVWLIPVYDEDKNGELEAQYTLVVCGTVDRLYNSKPNRIDLYYGKYKESPNQDHIEIREDDVWDFVMKHRQQEQDPNGFSYVMEEIKKLKYNGIMRIEITNPLYKYPACLTTTEKQEILALLQGITITEKLDDQWRMLNGSFTHIYVTDQKGVIHEFINAANSAFVIDGTAYKVSYEQLQALNVYTGTLLSTHQPTETVDADGIWCWHDGFTETGDFDFSEFIFVKQYPDLAFNWVKNRDGTRRDITAYNTRTGQKVKSVTTMGQAYFADINGDSYPELITDYEWGLNSRVVWQVDVWDIHNERAYSLYDQDEEYTYQLFEENGELLLTKYPADRNYWNPYEHLGTHGRLVIKDSKLEFVPV